LGITRAEEKGLFESDSVLTVFFAGFMAMGVLILVSSGAGSEEAIHFLFGDISTIQMSDLLGLLGVTVLVCFYVLKYRKQLSLLCLHRDLAVSEGVPVRRHIYLLNFLAAVTVVCLLGLMGIILATALLVGPALIAASFSRNLKSMLISSAVIGIGCSVSGLYLSSILGWASGSTIAVLTLALFLISLLFKGES
jgi:zinc transport system permease protein